MTSGPMETQPERTALSWQRTGFGVLAVAFLLARIGMQSASRLMLAAACVVALLGLAVLGALAPLRYRQVRRSVAAGSAMSAPGMMVAVTVTVVVTGAAATVAVLMPH